MVDNFEFFVPISVNKSIDGSEEQKETERILKGFASTEDIDSDDEVVLQEGLDLSYFMKQGWINYHHRLDPEYIIGFPVKAEIVNKSFYLESKLFKDNKVADSVWNLATTLEKQQVPRKLGYSIQARAKERDGNIIKKAVVYMVSVTPIPNNPNALAWADVAKALSAGYGIDPASQVGGSALRLESLEETIKQLTIDTVLNLDKIVKDLRYRFDEALSEKFDYDWDKVAVIGNYLWYTFWLTANTIDELVGLVEAYISTLK